MCENSVEIREDLKVFIILDEGRILSIVLIGVLHKWMPVLFLVSIGVYILLFC